MADTDALRAFINCMDEDTDPRAEADRFMLRVCSALGLKPGTEEYVEMHDRLLVFFQGAREPWSRWKQ